MNKLSIDNHEIETEILDKVTRSIKAKNLEDFVVSQGYFHATDRLIQMETLRVAAQGRLCELLQDSEENFGIDKFMRQMSFYHYAKEEIKSLDGQTLALLESYAKGVNLALANKTPYEFKMVGHKPGPWSVADTMVTIKIMAFIGLAQGQQDLEKSIIQMIKGGVDLEKIKSLFSPNLNDISEDIIHLIKKVNLHSFSLPENAKFLKFVPKIQSSNNWVINGKLTGKDSFHCSDPHLEVNRIPSIWYETKAQVGDKTFFGITMPGCPGIVMGRNKDLCFSFTYGFMDMSDYFLEEIKSDSYREESEFKKLNIRKEVIKRKKFNDVDIFIKSTPNGIVEDNIENRNLSDGVYLSHGVSCLKDGAADTLKSVLSLFEIENIDDLSTYLSRVAISCNWLITDTKGNIVLQQSGLLPKRKTSGLFPVKGWIKEDRWQGYYDGSDLVRVKNPDCNYIVTANNDLNMEGFPKAINAPMESYRRDRIEDLILENKDNLTLDLMKDFQKDVYSLQAEKFILKYRDIFNKNSVGQKLISWNKKYNVESKEASLFEDFYYHLLEDIFTDNFMDRDSSSYVIKETNLITDFYGLFDKLFLEDENTNLWFSKKSREDYIFESLEKTAINNKARAVIPWGKRNSINMDNIFFGGKLPAFLGFDIKDVQIPGNRATVTQGAVYQAHGRASSFCPSWRLVTQMDSDTVYTVLPGGLSDRRFSDNYKSDVSNWILDKYRTNKI